MCSPERDVVAGSKHAPTGDASAVLGPVLGRFVDQHIHSLLGVEVLLFFQRNPDAVMDVVGLASNLGRSADETRSEVETLCDRGILSCSGGLIRCDGDRRTVEALALLADACRDRERRPALIASIVARAARPGTSAGVSA